nr:transposase [Bacilli bacterium]
NGYVVDRPSSVDRRKQIIKRLNKAVLRRSRGSSGWKAGKIAIAQQHDAIRRAMDDFVEKLTTFLCRNCRFIAIEDLDIKEMTSSKRLAQNIMTASWGKFMSRLEQKCSSYGVILIKIGRYYPSTQVCSSCGYRNPKAAHLECRTWTCPSCGATHDRDLNAAKSIKKEGLRLYRLKRSQYGK